MPFEVRASSCLCGRVRCEGRGEPILSAVCYCLDCQEGGRRIEALPGAPRVLDDDGGAPYLIYRDDRFRCVSGEELLVDHRLKPNSPTRRVVASCCNSGMFLKFDPGFWVSSYRHRHSGELPPIDMRTNLLRRRATTPLPSDAPGYRSFPLKLIEKLIAARVAMLLGR
jgi:hypothetical protein